MWRRLLVGSAVLMFTACASVPGSGLGRSAGAAAYGTARAVISASEILASSMADAYDAVSQLRPEFLMGERRTSPTIVGGAPVRVFLDNVEIGGVDALKNMPVDNITQIRYLGGQEATVRWGLEHRGGVIQVSTKKRPPD